MVKALHIRMNINAGLKTELQDLANAENRALSNFIETELAKLVSASTRSNESLMPPRQERVAFLSMRLDAKLKAKLHKLAKEDYRGLTDFTETLLIQIVAAHRAKHKSPKTAKAREPKCNSVNEGFKAALQTLANEQYRTLTDFIEIELHRVVAARKAK